MAFARVKAALLPAVPARAQIHPIGSTATPPALRPHVAAHFPDAPDAFYDIKDPVFDLIKARAEA